VYLYWCLFVSEEQQMKTTYLEKYLLSRGHNKECKSPDGEPCTCWYEDARVEYLTLLDESKKSNEYKAEMEAYKQSYENLSVFYKNLVMANQKLAQTGNK
jgi:hypothetical protein